MNQKNENIQGNLSVSRNATIGGNLQTRGNAKFDHNVLIKGWLDAKNIKGPCKGLYASLEKLNEAYPKPMPGWYALVGNTLPADVYRVDGREWVATGEKGGEVNLYLDQLEQDVADLDDEVKDIQELIDKGLLIADSVKFNANGNAVTMIYKLRKPDNTETQYDVTVPIVTDEKAGMMSATDKQALTLAKNTISEYNVSVLHPIDGIDGTNKYTLETAIAMVPASIRNVGIKCSFLDEDGELETWEFRGGTFPTTANWRKRDAVAVVQELGDSENAVMSQKCAFSILCALANGINGNIYNALGTINPTNGIIQSSSASNYVTGFLQLHTNQVLVIGYASEATACLAFYDEGYSFISSVYGDENSGKLLLVDVPENAVYCRACGQEGKRFVYTKTFEEFQQMFSSLTFLNVSDKYPLDNASEDYYTLQTARKKVPLSERKRGHIISFLSGFQKWEYWFWFGNSDKNDTETGWNNDDLWYKIGIDIAITNVSKEYPLSEGYYTLQTARTVIPVSRRRSGHIIMFQTSSQKYELWHWLGNSDRNDTETGWLTDILWKRIPYFDEFDKLFLYQDLSFGDTSKVELIDGYAVNATMGAASQNANTSVTDFLPCSGYGTLHLLMTSGASSDVEYGMAFFNKDKKFINGLIRPTAIEGLNENNRGTMYVDIEVPEDAVYFRATYWNSTIVSENGFPTFSYTYNSLANNLSKILDEDIKDLSKEITLTDAGYINYQTGSVGTDSSVTAYTNDYIGCKGANYIILSMNTGNAANSVGIAFYDENRAYISGENRPIVDGDYVREMRRIKVPDNACYFRTSYYDLSHRIQVGEFICIIVRNKYLDKNAYKKEYLTQDEICDFYAIDGTNGEKVSASNIGCTRYVDVLSEKALYLPVLQITGDNLGYAFYDIDKNYICGGTQKGDNDFTYKKVDVPKDAAYIRFSGRTYAWLKTNDYLDKDEINVPCGYLPNGKRPYQDGLIFFSAKVNQKINKYWDASVVDNTDDDYEYTTGVLILPKNYTQTGKPVPLIMYCHGYSHGVWYDHWGDTDTFLQQKEYWASKGYAVFDCNGARNNNMTVHFTSAGCNQFVEGYRKCYEYIVKHYNVDKNIFVIGGSAGGPTAINYAYTWAKEVRALALFAAWTDIKTCAWGQNQKKSFVEYMGFENTDTYEDEKTIGFNPILRVFTLNDKDYAYIPVPVKAWIGKLENSTVYYEPLHRFIDACRNMGCEAFICDKDGLGHEIVSGHILCIDNEVLDWFDGH